MKKIVSTIFKCGAIFASINVVLGIKPEVKESFEGSLATAKLTSLTTSREKSGDDTSDSEVLSYGQPPAKRAETCIPESKKGPECLRSESKSDSDDTGNDSLDSEDLKHVQPSAKRAEICITESKKEPKNLRPEPKSFELPDKRIKVSAPVPQEVGKFTMRFNELLSIMDKRPDKEKVAVFFGIVKKINALGTHEINLHPNNLVVSISSKNEVLDVVVEDVVVRHESETYQLMQVDQSRRAFECLFLYTMIPAFRNYFLEDRIHFENGCFCVNNVNRKFSVTNPCLIAISVLCNKSIPSESVEILMKNILTYLHLLQALGRSLYSYDYASRMQARCEVKTICDASTEEFLNVVEASGFLLNSTVALLCHAEAGAVPSYLALAKNAPRAVKKLQEIISKRQINVSPEAEEIIWTTFGKLEEVLSGYEGYLSQMPLEEISEYQRLRLLLEIAQANDVVPVDEDYSLYPKDIHLEFKKDTGRFLVKFKPTDPSLWNGSSWVCRLMQIKKEFCSERKRQIFACLLVYVMVPEFCPWFASNYIDISRGCFEVHNPWLFDCYDRLPFNNIYVKLANLIIQGKVKDVLKMLQILVNNPGRYKDLLENIVYNWGWNFGL